MNQALDEKIDVLVAFNGKSIFPIFFKWREKKYKVENVNLIYTNREAGAKIYYFSVNDGLNYFKLWFNPNTLQWKIKELYSEG